MIERLRRLRYGDLLLLAALSIGLQSLFLATLPLALAPDGLENYLYARFLAGDPGGVFRYESPPGYALFLLLSGAAWLKSFSGTVAAQAAMGVLAPFLVYGSLVAASRRAAFAGGLLYALSGVPYAEAKLLPSAQLFVFCLLTATCAVARFVDGGRIRYAFLAVAAAVAALMLRHESLLFAVFAFVFLLFFAWPPWRRLAIVVLAGGAALALVLAWSAERAAILEKPELFGSLDNALGHQLFWRVYVSLPGPVRFWQCTVALPPAPACADGAQPITPLVRPENGPATRRLAEFLDDWAAANHRKPAAVLAAFLSKPSDAPPYDWNGLAARLATARLGPLEGDDLLRQAAIEAVRAHPETLAVMGAAALAYFGISFENFSLAWKGHGSGGPIVFATPQVDAATEPAEGAERVRQALPPELWRQLRASNEAPMTPLATAVLEIGPRAAKLVQGAVGLVFLATLPALLWARPRSLVFFLLGALGLMLGAYAVAFGYSLRLAPVILPLTIMPAVVAVDTVVLRLAIRWHYRRYGPAARQRGSGPAAPPP